MINKIAPAASIAPDPRHHPHGQTNKKTKNNFKDVLNKIMEVNNA